MKEDQQQKVVDLIAAERMLFNGAPTFEINRPDSMAIRYFDQRPIYADVEFIIYKLYRKLYISIWFYFFPIVVLIISYAAPLFYASQRNNEEK